MAKHPVKIEIKKARGACLEVKRFYMPGVVIKTMCPRCGAAYERDYGVEYLSYPYVGQPFKETLYCAEDGNGTGCGHEWEVPLRLDVTLSTPTKGQER